MKKAVLALIALLAAAGTAVFVLKKSPDNKMGGFPYSQPSPGMEIQPKESNFAASQRLVFQIKAGLVEGEAILVPAQTAAEGEGFVESQIFGIKSTFLERPAPYAGQITSRVACDSQKYVKERAVPFAGSESRLILAVASGRRLFGSCSAEEIKFAAVIWAAFDRQRGQAVTVKLFKPVAGPQDIAPAQQEALQVLRKLANLSSGE